MSVTGYDFCGWATKNDLKCADGRVIRHGAFTANDGKKVPLVWNHQHNAPDCVLGHAILENRDDGVFAYGFFNNTKQGQDAKEQVKHGDVEALSIWANNLQQAGSDVLHGVIREVSLVLSGANPGAFIESVAHSNEPMDDWEEEGIIYTDESLIIEHSEPIEVNDKKSEENTMAHSEENKEESKVADSAKKQESIEDVINTMTDKQKEAMYTVIGMVKEGLDEDVDDEDNEDDEEEDVEMAHHNIFENEEGTPNNTFLSHSDMETIISNARRCGSLKEAFEDYTDGAVLAHSIDTTGMETATGTQTYGFNDPDMLFPDYRAAKAQPDWISRNMDWVSVVMNGVHKIPYTRVKSLFADITEDEARARGYIKGDEKISEVFTTLKRTTDPQTIYKLQKMDRDDIIDITDFDVVAWIKAEMRVMLDEEIARAILIGDGRLGSDNYKIQEAHVRPIINDVPLFNIKYGVDVPAGAGDSVVANKLLDAAILARENYKGSGNPIFFTTERVLSNLLLLKDDIGHRLFKSEGEVATALRVSRIVTVEVMKGHKVPVKVGNVDVNKDLIGLIVNLNDYSVGCDKGGQVSLFDDFDLNFNKYEYLIETRISGALTKPFSAITLYKNEAS